MESVDFYYSIGSRYSYLASTQIDALEQETSCHVEWQPINSVRLIAQRELSPFDGKPVSGQYEWDYRELDAKRWANLYGVPYYEPRERVDFDSELLAKACTAAKNFGKVKEYSCLLFAEMFRSSLPKIIDEKKCAAIAQICDISGTDFQAVLTAQETTNQLDTTIDRAIQSGVFGVPTFIASGQLFWGNDRIVLLRQHLLGI